MGILRRDFLADDLLSAAKSCGIQGVVSVQARQTIEETCWLLDEAASCDWIRGVVGWLPLSSANICDEMDRFKTETKLRGLRHVVQDEADDGFMAREDFHRGVNLIPAYGWTYDLLILGRQLPFAIPFVDRHPSLTIILDHIAKPTIQSHRFDHAWEEQIRELAKRPNVYCKFSGVATEVRDRNWTIDMIRPYWNVAWEAFGSSRLMFGSDWPVCLLKTDYSRWVDTVQELIAPHSQQEQSNFWTHNAINAYKL